MPMAIFWCGLTVISPTEVDLLTGDPSKASKLLDWEANGLEELVREMVSVAHTMPDCPTAPKSWQNLMYNLAGKRVWVAGQWHGGRGRLPCAGIGKLRNSTVPRTELDLLYNGCC